VSGMVEHEAEVGAADAPEPGRQARRTPLRGHPGPSDGESTSTALLAVAANIGVALAKAVAAVLTGSAAMLAETLHSIADVGNEGLLLLGVSRSRRPADSRHPRGYGRDRYFWSLLAAVGIFMAGGLASVAEGVVAWRSPRELDHVLVAIAVLVVSAVLEGASWLKARRQVHSDADDHDVEPDELIDVTSDPTPVTVFLEDSAALIGLALAGAGVVGHVLTGSGVWDAAASVAVGLLLMWIAVRLVLLNRRLLLAPSVPPAVTQHVRSEASDRAWVVDVPAAVVVYVGPGSVSVSLDVEADLSLSSRQLVDEVAALRATLVGHEGVTSVAVTLVPGPGSSPRTSDIR
jgi:cation diffusion facilitator family transporter